MQSIIIYFIISTFCSFLLSNFLILAKERNGNDFNLKEYIRNIKIENIDKKYIFIFFILFMILSKFLNLTVSIIYIPVCFCLILTFCMDIKYMIIPDTCNIVIFACAIVKLILNFSLLNCLNCVFGFLLGGMFFYIINIIFKLFSNKTGFGFGDIKLLATLGCFFGVKNILVIIILSIFISAIFSIFFIVINLLNKKKKEYLPFGPFIVISSFIITIVPVDKIVNIYFYFIDTIVQKML